jgi:hypothetical protein
MLQLESGYTYTYNDDDGVRTSNQTVPEFLLRIGLIEDWELRVGWIGASLTENLFKERNDAGRLVNRQTHDDGATDMTVGFKWHLWDQKGALPGFGVIGELSLPTGTDNVSAGDVEPQVKLLWAYDITDDWSVAGNINMAVVNGENGQFFQPAASITTGYAITDWWGTYVEYYGFYPNEKDSDCAHYLNGGFTFLITDYLQWDVRVGMGLNEEADDFFTGTGFALRL